MSKNDEGCGDKENGAFTPLTADEIEEIRGMFLEERQTTNAKYPAVIAAEAHRRYDTLCSMAINSLLYAREVERLRSVRSAAAPSAPLMADEDVMLSQHERIAGLVKTCESVLSWLDGNHRTHEAERVLRDLLRSAIRGGGPATSTPSSVAPMKPLFTEASLFADLKGWCAETFGGVWGVSRMADNDKAVLVSFRRLTDDELRDFHDALAGRSVRSATQALTCPRCGDEWRGQACVGDCPLWKMAAAAPSTKGAS